MLLKALRATKTGSPFRRNFFNVLQANVTCQAIAVAAMPVITRLYAPVDLGAFALFSAVTSLLLAGATCRFDWCLPNARSLGVASALMVCGLLAVLVVVVLTLVAIWVGGDQLLLSVARAPGKDSVDLGKLTYLIPPALLGMGVVTMFQGWYVRTNDLTVVSRSRINQTLAKAAVDLGAGVAGIGAAGLVGSYAASRWVEVATLAQGAKSFWSSLRRLTVHRLKAVVVLFGREAAWSTLVSLLNTLSLSVTVLLIAAFYSLREAGWYSLMTTLAAGPISLITSALGQSFWANAAILAKAGRMRELHAQYLKTTRRLALLAVPVVMGCALGSLLVGPVFGEAKWGGAGHVLLAMAPMLAGTIIFSPTNHLVVLKRQIAQLFCDASRLVLVVAAIVLSKAWGLSITMAVAGAACASLLGHLMLFIIHLREHAAYGR